MFGPNKDKQCLKLGIDQVDVEIMHEWIEEQ